MWAMQQSTQPNYIPANTQYDEENYDPNTSGQAQTGKRSSGGRTHFNIFLNQRPEHQYASPPQQQQFERNPNMWFTSPPPPQPVFIQAQSQPALPLWGQTWGQPMAQQQPAVILLQQPQQKEEKPKEEPKPPPPAPPAPKAPPSPPKPEDMLDICIASIIIFGIGFILGICAVVRTSDAYEAHLEWEEDGAGLRTGELYDSWQMLRNTALGTGAAAVLCFSLAFLLVFWSGVNHKMKRKVVAGFVMAGTLISGWIVFALTFLVDVVVLVLAFDEDNVVYPEVVWAAFIGNVVAWLLMLTHSEMARTVQ